MKYSPQYGGRCPRHFHAEPELNLVVSGTATFGIGEEVVTAASGDMLGFPPGQDHALLEGSPDLYLFAIGLDSKYSAEVLRADGFSSAVPLHLRLELGDFETLIRRASAVVDQRGVDQAVAELWEQAYWLRQRHNGGARGETHALTRRALSLVAEEPQLDLQDMARRMRASRSSISRMFHSDLGMTLQRYRTRTRLLRFISLVDAGSRNLSTCAVASGFGSYSQCHRVFHAEFGCSPRQFVCSNFRHSMQHAREP